MLVAVIALGATAPAAGAATVNKTDDTDDGVCDADCSLREAIDVAASGETVTVPASPTPYEVTDALGTLLVEKNLTIAGAGARLTEVTATGTVARPFTIRATASAAPVVTIRDISITGGDGNGGGFGGTGGGVLAIDPGGTIGPPQLRLDRVRVANNTASISGSFQAVGGGVASDQPGTHITIRDSLITGNQVIGTGGAQASGGGVATFASSTMAIENTTVVGNQAFSDSTSGSQSARGGGVMVVFGPSSLLNVTVAFNSALRTTPNAIEGSGGNLRTATSGITVQNTIVTGGVADQAATADCTQPLTTLSQGGNVVPASCSPGAGDQTTSDAMLGGLADNGGQTDTLALLAGSPAIDAATGCPPPAADQRGVSRPQGPACDSGAFELQAASPVPPTAPKCQGKTATVVGTNGADTLRGTKKADVIASLGGKDTISALAGNDRVCAGKGNDKVTGGKGKDRLNGEKGKDRLLGGRGKDRLKGGKGKDTLLGGPGTDTLAGGPGKDVQTQ